MYKLAELKKKLEELKIHPKKALGQNFLIHQLPIDRAVNILDGYPDHKVFEIGPGLGALTDSIIEKKRELTLIELDSTFAAYWKDKSIEVIHKDALKLDWQPLLASPAVLISNLPYQISASLVIDMSILISELKAMVLMFQKEVGERIQSKAKTDSYGLLSVVAQTFWDVEFVIDAGPKDFYPPPKIASRILHFKKKDSQIAKPEKFLTLVKAAFAQRRKLLKKNLSAILPAAEVEAIFLELEISVNARAEDLSPDDYIRLYKRMNA
jgi:16S rRNA (adenine1518-N6/adenine1519-N6)-dimethyltransferase